jgi:hypothetical protein
MKRKVKKFAGDEGSVVRTRSDKEFEEDNKYGGYGRYMPKTKEYTFDEAKEKLSGLFGGKKEDTSKFDELESVKKTKTLAEQIGRKAEPKASEQDTEEKSNRGERAQTNMMPKGNYEYKGSMPEASDETPAPVTRNSNSGSGRSSSSSGSSSSSAVPKADKKADAPKNAAPKVDASKAAEKPYPKNARPLKPTTNEEKATIKKRGEQDDADQERLRKQFDKTTADNKAAADQLKNNKPADAPKKTEKRYGQGLTPYEKGKTLSEWSKMLGGGKKETAKETSKSSSKDDDEKLAATRRRAAGMFQKTNEGVYGMKKGGSVSSASKRADGIAQRGKTKGKMY